MRMRVQLHKDCLDFKGGEEYPNGWIGHVVGQKPEERLSYIRFASPFFGKDARGKPKRKTDKQNGMFIPDWLLVPAFSTYAMH